MMNSKGKFICTTCRSLHVEVFREMGTCRDYTTYSCSICNNKHSAVDGEPGSTFIKRKEENDFYCVKINKSKLLEIIKTEEEQLKISIKKIDNNDEIFFIYNNNQECWYILLEKIIYLPPDLNIKYNIIEELNFNLTT